MRRIFKKSPPKDVLPDEQEPCGLLEAEERFKASLATAADRAEHARTEFDNLDKAKLRAALYEEQRYICVYCECRVEERKHSKTPRIDHWLPLSDRPDMALHWKNLNLSCTSEDSCDGFKKNKRLMWSEEDGDLPPPSDAPYEEWLGFTSDGEVYIRADAPESRRRALELAVSDQDDGGQRRESVLNLNHPALREARRAAIDAERERLDRHFPKKTATEQQRRARAEEMLSANKYPEFVSIRVAWLRRTLGKHRRIRTQN